MACLTSCLNAGYQTVSILATFFEDLRPEFRPDHHHIEPYPRFSNRPNNGHLYWQSQVQACCFLLPNYPWVDVTFDDDKAVQQDGAQQHEHASTVCQHNVARDHSGAAKERHPDLVRYKDDCPIHEEPANKISQ